MVKLREISPALFDAELRDVLMDYALRNGERVDELTKAAAEQLVALTRESAPRGSRIVHRDSGAARPHFFTSIAYKKLTASWFGASQYLWYVKKPNYRLTHLLAKSHKTRSNRDVAGNPFLQNALDTVLRDYEEAIRRYFVE